MRPEISAKHEQGSDPEPKAAHRPIPVWLAVMWLLLLSWGMLYFDQHGGGFCKEVYTPYHSLEELSGGQPPSAVGRAELGRKVYNKPSCVACHQADAKGTPGQFPPLVKSHWVNELQPGRLIRLVLNGLTGPLEVQGQTYNSAMVPWKDVLNDEEIAAVLTYIRQNKDWGNNAPEVKPHRVREVREKIKDRGLPFTPGELTEISPAD